MLFTIQEKGTTIANSIVEWAITIDRAIENRNHESMNTTDKKRARRLQARTFVIAQSDNCMGSDREKSNIAIAILENFTIWKFNSKNICSF